MGDKSSPQLKGVIRAFLGVVIKFADNIEFQELTLQREYIPKDLQGVEGEILDAVWGLRMNIPPMPINRDNVARWVAVTASKPHLVAELDTIMKEVDDEDASGLPVYGAFIEQWMQNVSGIKALEKASRIMSEPTADYAEKYERAASAFSQAMPKSSTQRIYTEEQLIQLVMKENRQAVEDAKRTGSSGWGMPFAGHHAFFSRFKPMEVTTFIAPTGVGKTTLMMVTAEYQAWKQELETDQVLFLNETTPNEIGQRQIARHLRIPFDAIDGGYVDLSDGLWKPRVDAFLGAKKLRSNTKGHIHLVYCPGASVDEIVMLMQGYAMASAAAGRRCVFWLDNLQRVNWTVHGLKKNEAYVLICDRLSYAIRRYPNTHMFIVAQEKEGEDRVFGSTEIESMSQKMISFKREEPEGGVKKDLPIMEKSKDDAGKVIQIQSKDALGGKRYWERKGDRRSGKGTLEIIKINSGRAGTIEVWLEGALNIMKQDPIQLKKLIDEGQIRRQQQ